MVKSPFKLYTRFPCHALSSNYIRLFA
jgi:hypothetical protein